MDGEGNVCQGFLKDLESAGNADLIYLLEEMEKNNLPGAVEDIRQEIVQRFCKTHWSYIEERLKEDKNGNTD